MLVVPQPSGDALLRKPVLMGRTRRHAVSHMVIYRGTDGKPGYHQTDDIHDAVIFVEQLRNDDGVEHARIFRLEEVVFEYRPYFRVELRAAEPMLAPGPSPMAAVAAAPPPEVVASPPIVIPEPVMAAPAPSAAVITAPPTSAPTGAVLSPPPLTGSPASAPTEPLLAPPSVSEAASDAANAPDTQVENGMGARRGLFGR